MKGSWSTDVPEATITSAIGTKHSEDGEAAINRTNLYKEMLMSGGRIIECPHADLVEVLVDGTGSMGDWAGSFRDKSVRLVGQVNCQNYLQDPAFGFIVIGDANQPAWGGSPDRAPIQMTELVDNAEAYRALVPRLYMEGGGGGQARENYDLGLYGLARKIKFTKERRKGFIFILGDEGFYEVIKPEHVRKHFGDNISQPIQTSELVVELKKHFYIYCLHIITTTYSRERYWEIQDQWRKLLGENFIHLVDPQSYMDVILGCIAMQTATRTIDDFIDKDLVEQKQTEERRALVRTTLNEINWQL